MVNIDRYRSVEMVEATHAHTHPGTPGLAR